MFQSHSQKLLNQFKHELKILILAKDGRDSSDLQSSHVCWALPCFSGLHERL